MSLPLDTPLACSSTPGAQWRVHHLVTALIAVPPPQPFVLCVPKTSSTSCDQAIFVDQTTDASLFSDAVLAEIDWLG
jgi:hypothetical protein